MKHLTRLILIGGLMTAGLQAPAQDAGEVEQLRKQLQEMKAAFEAAQKQQREQIEALQKQLDSVQQQQRVVAGTTNFPQPADIHSAAAQGAPAVAKPWSPADPIRVTGGAGYVDVSFDGLFAVGGSTADDIEGGTQLGGHDPVQRGFTVQNLEMTLSGAVDPYFRGQANLIYQVDSGGESLLEVEEAFAETTSLPGNLQVKGGQFFTEFGRLNATHPHSWSFVDQPLVNGRFLGADGLRNAGARVSWLMPTPFYSEFFLAVQNSHGETAASFRSGGHGHGGEEEGVPFGFRHADNDRGVRGIGDMLFTPRLATSFELTDSQTLLLGASAAFGPNSSGSGGDTTTQIYGVDAYWKWKPANAHGGFPFVSWQTEAMVRRYELGAFDWQEEADAGETPIIDEGTGLPAVLSRETVTDYGFYSQVLYGFRKGWVAGLRFDYVGGKEGDYEKLDLTYDGESLGRDLMRNDRWRVSPNLTWYPSEFSKIRLQYNYDDREDMGVDHSVWLQFEFLLGAHAAHKF